MKPREQMTFDDGWRFHRGDVKSGERPELKDGAWRPVHLPHDWSVEDLPGRNTCFSPKAIGSWSNGFLVGGTAWYRKRFTIPAAAKGKRIRLEFDGVYMNADVWVNGSHAGGHPYGYTAFWFDITPQVKFGGANVIAVRVKNEGKNTRWYSGSGIYRHVKLTFVNEVSVEQWGTYVTTPRVDGRRALVRVKTTVANGLNGVKRIGVRTAIVAPGGRVVGRAAAAKSVDSGLRTEFDQSIRVSRPDLWSPETPALYRAVTQVVLGGRVVDEVATTFGIRTLSFDAKYGFKLNGKVVLMKGACMHHDNGVLGAAAFDAAEERRVRTMKESGYNAIRTAHNPPSAAFLDACDRLGVMVMDETFDHWEWKKNPQDYHNHFKAWWHYDVSSMVLRDRNHPCVVVWSIGNEIPERGTLLGIRNGRMQAELVRSLDPTRPVTEAVCGRKEPWEDFDPYFANHDVAGYNYQFSKYVPDHQRAPNRVIAATESFPMQAFEYWMNVVDHSYVYGDFVWTGHDYLGEAAIGWWSYNGQPKNLYPWTVAYCGDIDLIGNKRAPSYYRDVLWGVGSRVSIFVHAPRPTFGERKRIVWGWDDSHARWNWPGCEGKRLKVDVYAACDSVRLFLNGEDLGRKATSRKTRFKATFEVPYQPGVLRAVGYDGKKEVAEWELRTAGRPAQIQLTPEANVIKAGGQDLCFVRVAVVDAIGTLVPNATNLLKFRIEGAGTLAGAGNGNPKNVESFQRPQHSAFEGRALVVVRSGSKPGEIRITAESAGLRADAVTVTVK